jgi:hypothetical protein
MSTKIATVTPPMPTALTGLPEDTTDVVVSVGPADGSVLTLDNGQPAWMPLPEPPSGLPPATITDGGIWDVVAGSTPTTGQAAYSVGAGSTRRFRLHKTDAAGKDWTDAALDVAIPIGAVIDVGGESFTVTEAVTSTTAGPEPIWLVVTTMLEGEATVATRVPITWAVPRTSGVLGLGAGGPEWQDPPSGLPAAAGFAGEWEWTTEPANPAAGQALAFMEKIALAPTDKAGADHTAALAALKAGDVVNVGGHPFTVNRVVDSAGGPPGTKVLRFDSPGPASDLFAEGAVVKISAGATDGSVLTLDNGQPAWLPAAGGGDEVEIGPTEPTDPNIKVWINPNEQGTYVPLWQGTQAAYDALPSKSPSTLYVVTG